MPDNLMHPLRKEEPVPPFIVRAYQRGDPTLHPDWRSRVEELSEDEMTAIGRDKQYFAPTNTPPYPNTSGITPLDLVALVYPDPVEAVTKGGIIIPEPVQDRQKYHTQKATLIAVGKSCFTQWVEKPQPGERVLIVQYAGTLIKGKDGEEYRIIKEDDLIAGLEE